MRGMNKKIGLLALLGLLSLAGGGCAPDFPPQAFQAPPTLMKNRELQTRRFDTDEKTLLKASAALLQDTGFTIDESETKVGLIVCSKTREALTPQQKVGALILMLFTGADVGIDKVQFIRATVVTFPLSSKASSEVVSQTALRIVFQRMVMNRMHQVMSRESIQDPAIYREFFDKLSQSLFLEAHGI